MTVVVSMNESDKEFVIKAMNHYLGCPIAFEKEMEKITRQKRLDRMNRDIKKSISHHFRCILIHIKDDDELKRWFKEKYKGELK